jgi:hypothetical protein
MCVLAERYDAFTFRGQGSKVHFAWNPLVGERVDVDRALKLFRAWFLGAAAVMAYEEQAPTTRPCLVA